MAGKQEARPEYGRRLMVNIIDHVAQKNPERTWVMIPQSSNPQEGWRSVSFKTASNAINSIARKIIEIAGQPAEGEFPTIAYIGPNDIRYMIMMFGAVKAGYQALFPSPRNSVEAQHSLLERTDCHMLWYASPFKSLIQPWLHERQLKSVMVGSIDEWLPSGDVEPLPYEKTWEEARWDPLVVLHTSGSTGIPKPIIVRQGMLAIGDTFHGLPDLHGTRFWMKEAANRLNRLFVPMPLFHAAALYVTALMTLYWDTTVVFGLGERPLSPDLIVECLASVDVDGIMLPPSIVEEMSQSQEQIQALAQLKIVAFVGGQLAPEAGNILIRNGVPLANAISTTEFTPYPIYYQPNPQLWRYFIFNSEVFGCDWRKTDEEGVFEQVIVRKDKDPGLQGFFYTFPDATEYSTRDLYRKHPELPEHWLYHGRADNIIVFSNGEKLNPISIEDTILAHPDVKGALVVGSQRFQPALIVEPSDSYPKGNKAAESLLEKVWPLVVQANKENVAHGQIGRQFIALSNPDKPFIRTAKGTIQRAATLKLYEDDIDHLYETAGFVSSTEAKSVDVSSEEALLKSLVELFTTSLNMDATNLEPDTDFFSAGIDSLQVINASRLLRSSLEKQGVHANASNMATRVIYGNPTPRRLSHYLYTVVIQGDHASTHASEHEIHATQAQIDKYIKDLPVASHHKPAPNDEEQTVLLTGSTGALGSYILDFMCSSPRVKQVICLNRTEDGHSRQQRVNAERGLDTTFDKVQFYHADLGRFNLGLPVEVYKRIQGEVDRIIHNQWPVNFNISVESFEPHVRGVRNLVDLSAQAKKQVPIIFISSIAVVDIWKQPRPVPEDSIKDLTLACTGYGRSKLASSLILEEATRVSGIPTEIIRVGQIAGPETENGVWNRQEWLPSIVASSISLGILPSDLGTMNIVEWTPIERIAKMVLEVSGVTTSVPISDVSGYLHGVNPEATTWDKLAPAVQEFYGGKIKRLVPFSEWIAAVEKSEEGSGHVHEIPAVKLLDTYRSWNESSLSGQKHVEFDVTRTKQRSKTMAASKAITPELMNNWCRQWGF